MQLPRRIENDDNNNSGEHSGRCLIREIEDGIEVVPFERSNMLSAPILSPDQAEKELFICPRRDLSPYHKPLPRLPSSLWTRLSLKQRILALLGVQFALLLTIGLALMAAKHRPSPNDLDTRIQVTGDNSSTTQDMGLAPKGPFVVPIQSPQQQSSACLVKTNESVAWQCSSDTSFQLNILPAPSDVNATMITLGSVPRTNGTIYHGHQAPDVSPVEVKLVTNPNPSDSDGPAYHFRTTYDRIVLLKENDLIPADKPRPQPVMRHPTFQSGESLWQCVFNETLIEAYIYPNKKSAAVGSLNSTATSMSKLPRFPYALKLVEQRMPNGKEPYCEKMKLENGGLVRLSREKVMLGVAEPAAEVAAAKIELLRSARFRARQSTPQSNYCRCQWMVQ